MQFRKCDRSQKHHVMTVRNPGLNNKHVLNTYHCCLWKSLWTSSFLPSVPGAALLQDGVVLARGVARAMGAHEDVRRHRDALQVRRRDRARRRLRHRPVSLTWAWNSTCQSMLMIVALQGQFNCIQKSLENMLLFKRKRVLVPFTSTEKMLRKCGENQHLSHILSTCYQCSSHNISTPTYYQLFNQFNPTNYQFLNKLSSFFPLQNQHFSADPHYPRI